MMYGHPNYSHHQHHRHHYRQQDHCYRRRPPPLLLPHFVVLLRRPLDDSKPLNPRSIDDLIASIPSPPKDPLVFSFRRGLAGAPHIAARLPFPSLSDALEAFSFLWRRRLEGAHVFVPDIDGGPNLSLKDEALQDVKKILVEHVKGLVGGSIIVKCRKRAEEVDREIEEKNNLLKRYRNIDMHRGLTQEKERLQVEVEQINGRVEEFLCAIRNMLSYLEEGKDRELERGEVDVLRFGSLLDLHCLARVHSVVMRECRRLKDGLPIYACRREILRTIFFNQVWSRCVSGSGFLLIVIKRLQLVT